MKLPHVYYKAMSSYRTCPKSRKYKKKGKKKKKKEEGKGEKEAKETL
jgi:hypothetical protein